MNDVQSLNSIKSMGLWILLALFNAEPFLGWARTRGIPADPLAWSRALTAGLGLALALTMLLFYRARRRSTQLLARVSALCLGLWAMAVWF
jgi:hypothetical protein